MTTGAPPPGAARRFRHFVFDCDSTLSRIEGIEELAQEQRAAVTAMTQAAMEGQVPLEEVYGRRLQLVAPTQALVRAVGARYVAELVDDAAAVVAALQTLGKDVHILSGGVRPAVLVVAAHLGVPESHVHAVDLRFAPDGSYQGFDQHSPLARRGGKPVALRQAVADPAAAVLVGDGVTDLEARDLVGLFVGFGGVAVRAEVERQSPVFVRCPSLAPLLALALTPAEQDDLARRTAFAPLLARARALAVPPHVTRHEA